MLRAREENKCRALVVTGEEREGDVFFGMLGRRGVTPGWEDDLVRRQDGRRRLGRQEIRWQEGRVERVQ